MPSSSLVVAPAVMHYLWEARPADRPIRVVDVGPGWGKYATLIREYIDSDAEISAIEKWEGYIDEHRLDVLYDAVIPIDVLDLIGPLTGSDPETEDVEIALDLVVAADVVLLVDVVEHLEKRQALRLLDALPGYVIVCTPRDFFHNPAHLPEPERHVSHWTADDFFLTGRLDRHETDMIDSLGAILVRLAPRGRSV